MSRVGRYDFSDFGLRPANDFLVYPDPAVRPDYAAQSFNTLFPVLAGLAVTSAPETTPSSARRVNSSSIPSFVTSATTTTSTSTLFTTRTMSAAAAPCARPAATRTPSTYIISTLRSTRSSRGYVRSEAINLDYSTSPRPSRAAKWPPDVPKRLLRNDYSNDYYDRVFPEARPDTRLGLAPEVRREERAHGRAGSPPDGRSGQSPSLSPLHIPEADVPVIAAPTISEHDAKRHQKFIREALHNMLRPYLPGTSVTETTAHAIDVTLPPRAVAPEDVAAGLAAVAPVTPLPGMMQLSAGSDWVIYAAIAGGGLGVLAFLGLLGYVLCRRRRLSGLLRATANNDFPRTASRGESVDIYDLPLINAQAVAHRELESRVCRLYARLVQLELRVDRVDRSAAARQPPAATTSVRTSTAQSISAATRAERMRLDALWNSPTNTCCESTSQPRGSSGHSVSSNDGFNTIR